MQPDGVHFHMLIYKRFAKSNAKTSVWILALYMPFVILSVIFAHQSFVLIALSFVFVVLYVCFEIVYCLYMNEL